MLPLLISVVLAAPAPAIRLADLIDEARKNNPELQAAREQASAAASSVAPAGALDDPMLMVQLWNAPVDFSSVPLMVQLSQPIPLGGKRAARRDAASGEAAAARANAAAKARDIEAAVAKAYFDLYLSDRTLEVDAEIEATLRSLISAASARIAAGKGEQSEALRAQAELLKVQSDREAVAARRVAASARLVALLNREADTALGPTTEPGLVDVLAPEAQLRERALHERPEVTAANAMTAQAEARLRLTRAEQVPDISVFVGEMHSFRTPGVSDFLFAGVQGNLPIWSGSKSRPRIDAASTQLSAARAEAKALENRIASEIADAYAEATAEKRQVELHHQLIPVARQALSSATASYAAGKGSFLMVLDSERDLLMHELDLATHLVMYEQRLAELERAVGADLGLARASESGVRGGH
ncbi:MAG TPA: TolC family protein [Candidatus Sulfotelmatobacter sp.]|nr:TolC family protein [Candidatus Sulfotelmatobacter sp.]